MLIDTLYNEMHNKKNQPEQAISRKDALKGLNAFKLFMLQSSQDRSDLLKIIEGLEKEMEAKIVQSKLTNFFFPFKTFKKNKKL